MTENIRYSVYLDTGGTFTDCVIPGSDGTFTRGKALTKPDRLTDSFFGSIENAANKLGKSAKYILTQTDEVGYGTTLGTNIIVTRKGGPKLGFITTRGFEDRTIVGRLRSAGLTRTEAMHLISADKPDPIIPRPLIKGVTERIDSAGGVIIPLREAEVRQAVNELLDEGVEGIAVGLLWSFLNPSHEVRVREIIREIAHEIPVALSSEVAPVAREYSRFMSTIIDLYIGKPLKVLLSQIQNDLSKNGYKKPLLVMQAVGGLANASVVKPGTTLHSGPVGGLAGVEFMRDLYGIKSAIGSDVGGTSFDVCVSSGTERYYLREPIVGRFQIATPMCEIDTIGAGGGTIARFHESSKTIRVGPDSAGSSPGPVCYGFGGTQPTVTDANVVMNRIDPNFFWGGTMKLDREKAVAAIKEKIADPMGMKVEDAAEAICKILDGQMETLLGQTMAKRGIDPSKFVLFAFGGAGAAQAAGYSEHLPFSKVIVPFNAAAFCAFGAATADIKHRYEASCYVSFSDIPYDPITLKFDLERIHLEQFPSRVIDRLNNVFKDLDKRISTEMAAEGFSNEKVTRRYEILARYIGQLWELRAPVSINHIGSAADLATILNSFSQQYETDYGREAMVPSAGVEIISLAAEGIAPAVKPKCVPRDYVGKDPSTALKGKREVYFNGSWVKTNVYDHSKLQVGNIIEGPSIIELEDTTVVVPRGRKITIDEYLNMAMERV